MRRPRPWSALSAVAVALGLVLAPAAIVAAPERAPAVAGRFYPGDPDGLRGAVQAFLRDARAPAASRPLALVVPHAGYVYSGAVAADGWRYASAKAPDLVVLLGTNHTAPGLRGAALSPAWGFRTPLGVAEIDRGAGDALRAADADVVVDAGPHAEEHSIEVQVPFVQVLFPRAKILPIVVGPSDPGTCERLGRALARALAGRNALVVASSDLSHYPAASDAVEVDGRVLAAMASLDAARFRGAVAAELARGVPGLATCACGEGPILAAMAAARAMGATRGTVIRYASSADVPAGERGRVVGYGAVAFEDGPAAASPSATATAVPAASLDEGARAALLAHAREVLVRWFEDGGAVPPPRSPPAVSLPRGAFVTLTKRGELRGCIGQIAPDGPVGATVGRMALEAALRDPRFLPVTREELPALHVEISVLGPMAPARAEDVVPGRDGVLLSKHGRRAVFLPQVATEQGWGRAELLDHLCEKAGLDAPCWREGAKLEVFQAEVFGEALRP